MHKAVLWLAIGIISIATAVACGSEDPTATTAPTATQPPAATSPPTTEAPTPTAEPRDTPAPTATQPPTPTPEPEAPPSAVVGDAAPGFTLPSASGSDVSLESYQGDKNVVLVFYRGSF